MTDKQRPTIGRIVHVEFFDRLFNGSAVHPAIVTAAHSETMINARVIVDGDSLPWLTSIEPKDAFEARPAVVDKDGKAWRPQAVWFWPPLPDQSG